MAKQFKYISTANAICADICTNLAIGERLPATLEICSRYDVSEITIKKALTFLAEQGIVKRAPRRGTVLCRKIDPESTPVQKSKTVVNVLAIKGWKFADAIKGIAENFCRENPGIKFIFTDQHEADYRSTLQKKDFDIVLANTLNMRELISSEDLKAKFRPLNNLKNFAVKPDEYFPNTLKWCEDQGDLLALPLTFSTIMTFINKNYPGLNPQDISHDMTVDEFKEFLLSHQPDANAEFPYPFYIFYSWNRWPIVLRSFGGSLFSEDGKHCLLDSPETTAALSYLREIIFKHKLCFPFATVQDARSINGAYDLFRFQSFLCTWGSFEMTHRKYAKNVMITHLPYAKKRTTHLQLACLMVSKNTGEESTISDFLNYIRQPENQQLLCSNTEGVSCLKNIGTKYIYEQAKVIDGLERFIESLEYAEPLHQHARFEDISYIQESLYPVWMGIQPIKETCAATAATVNKRIKKREKNKQNQK